MQATCIKCGQPYDGEADPLDHAMAAIWDTPLEPDEGICGDCWEAMHATYEAREDREAS